MGQGPNPAPSPKAPPNRRDLPIEGEVPDWIRVLERRMDFYDLQLRKLFSRHEMRQHREKQRLDGIDRQQEEIWKRLKELERTPK